MIIYATAAKIYQLLKNTKLLDENTHNLCEHVLNTWKIARSQTILSLKRMVQLHM